MIRYIICDRADKEIFSNQCNALEKNISNLVLKKKLIDVDDSTMQIYSLEGKKVIVCNSYYLNEVYIESEVDLKPYFRK